jgi:hypothetical protein
MHQADARLSRDSNSTLLALKQASRSRGGGRTKMIMLAVVLGVPVGLLRTLRVPEILSAQVMQRVRIRG